MKTLLWMAVFCVCQFFYVSGVQEDRSSLEAKLVRMVNQERHQHGLVPLSTWNVLAYHAKLHSQAIADQCVDFGHSGFEERARAIQKKGRCRSVGENVAYCYLIKDPLAKALELWMKSPGHRENILGDYNETGVGIAYSREGRCYLTQLFAKRAHREAD